jgi:hypothetical protein
VPSQTVIRDLDTAPPVYSGQGRRPQRPWQRVEPWATSLAEDAWRRGDVRDGATGPLVVDIVTRRVVSRTPRRQQGDEAMVVVRRYRDRDTQQVGKVDGYLSHAAPATPLWECARVAKAEPRMEEGLQRSTSEAGLADDEVRHWTGGHQHHTLAFLATWFLVTATQRGKNGRPRSRYRQCVKASRRACTRGSKAGRCPRCCTHASSDCDATRWRVAIIGNSKTDWPH